MSDITIYRAKNIITMNPRRETATHVAVRDGMILGTGSLDDLQGWGEYTLDDRFADKILMPGMIEGHCHAMEGSVWQDTYAGYYDRRGPDGSLHAGQKNIDEVVERLRQADAEIEDPKQALIAWGFDPIYFKGRRMVASDLDKVSTTRPVIVVHASFHIANVNSATLNLANITAETDVMGIVKDDTGAPTGELQGMPVRFMIMTAVGRDVFGEIANPENLWRFGRSAQLSGVTTATDLANQLPDDVIAGFKRVTDDENYPLRIVPAFMGSAGSVAEGVARAKEIRGQGTDKLRLGLVKLVSDGSIQGFTARMLEPGYYNGAENGLWYIAPDEIPNYVEAFHNEGLQVHIHTNGDQATEVVLDAIEGALKKSPNADARFTLQHCQLAHDAHYRRMARLGVCANLFANHIFYWGDQHAEQTVGPERAERMNAAATALRHGVPFSIHSDAPITPLAPLFTAWCAVTRTSMSGQVIGEGERISVEDALYAVTVGAAYTLKLDSELGSIETGKRADFAVLEADPLEVDIDDLKDIEIWGTVLGGKVFPCSEIR